MYWFIRPALKTVEDEPDILRFSKISLAAPERAARSLLGSKPNVSAGPPRGNKLITRLVPSRQCLSTVKRPTALLACVYCFHAVKKGVP